MRANQLRLWLSSVADVMQQTLPEHGLQETPLATARCDTMRLKLLKIGAVVRVTVRGVWFAACGSPRHGSRRHGSPRHGSRRVVRAGGKLSVSRVVRPRV
jgi:hypothetical protein